MSLNSSESNSADQSKCVIATMYTVDSTSSIPPIPPTPPRTRIVVVDAEEEVLYDSPGNNSNGSE